MQDDRKRRAKYLGFVAHEIKNPLSTALWSADLLKRLDTVDRAGPRADKMMDASLRALRRMRRLVDDFFTIERLAEHLLEMRREDSAVRALVDGAIGLLAEKEKGEAAAWTVDVPAELRADVDTELTKRALRAVFEHVARAGPGPVTVVGKANGGHPTLWIGRRSEAKGATGVLPLPPEEQPGGDADGSVLGFLLARTVVDAHEGKLEEREGGILLSLPSAKA